MRCWHGESYLSGMKCKWLAYAHMVQLMPQLPLPPLHLSVSEIQNGLSFWYQPTQVVLEKRLLNGCVCVCVLLLSFTFEI